MTGKAEILLGVGDQVVLIIGAVGAVTVDACLGNRSMGEFSSLRLLLFVGMAGKTDLVTLRDQHFGRIALVGIVTAAASAERDGRMGELLPDQGILVVAEEAELFAGSPELELVG
jgi:hypothetical protein